jgi:O-antigen ligase
MSVNKQTGQPRDRSFAFDDLFIIRLLAVVLFLTIFDNIFYLPTMPFLKTPSAILAFLALALFLLRYVRHNTIKGGSALLAMIFLLVISLIEYIHIELGTDTEFARFMQWIQPLILFLVAINLFNDQRALRIVGTAFLIATIFMSLVVLFKIGFFTSVGMDGRLARIGFSGVNLNQEAYYHAMGLVACLWFILHSPRMTSRNSLIAGSLCLLLTFSLFGTGSRGGLIVMFVGVLSILWFGRKTGNARIYAIALPMILAVMTIMFFQNDMIQQRVLQTFEDQHFSGRDKYFFTTISLFYESPIIGHGSSLYGKMGIALERYVPRATHNGFMQVILTHGLIGLFFWLPIIGSIAWRASWRFVPISNSSPQPRWASKGMCDDDPC